MIHPFNPLSMPHAATTNKDAAAIAYISRVQSAHDIERHKLSLHTQWMPPLKVLPHHTVITWHNKVQIYKPYFLVFIPNMLDYAKPSNRYTSARCVMMCEPALLLANPELVDGLHLLIF